MKTRMYATPAVKGLNIYGLIKYFKKINGKS